VSMAKTQFVDRLRELEALDQRYATEQAELIVVYGRRRVGKTELIRQFCHDKPHVYFEAAQVTDPDNLRHFVEQAGRATGEALLQDAVFEEWEPPLEYLARLAATQRLILVLDEFPYLCQANDAVPSLTQRFWDQHGQQSRLFLILCGSSVSFMEDEVLAERSPLYGRRTGQIRLQPLGYREAAEFVSGYSLEDKLRTWGILGGMPMYLARCDGGVPVAENVQRQILDPQSLLYDEPNYLLRTELREPRTYNSILQAIASGLTRRNEITQRAGQRAGMASIGKYLVNLEDLGLVERVVAVTDRAREKPSRGRYFIRDNFLRFWYRFVLPKVSMLEMGEGARVWEQEIAPHLDEYLGLVFEEVCREYVRRYAREKLPVLPTGEVGVYWHRDAEIEVLCRNADGSHYCGECKWSREPMDLRDLYALVRKAQTLPEDWRQGPRFLLFSRSGFADDVRAREDGEWLILVGMEDLYGVK